MRFLSVCSGIEAASVAWNPLGWKAAAFAEIEPFPCAVLAHHYPDTPNWGDMTKYQEWPLVPIDLLCGGTPCQSFSVAGLRKGLADPRGNLMLTFGAIAARYRPRWLVWENVPGVLSSNEGRDFGSFLGMLGQLGYGFAYRVLDAKHFGVPQQRRRVFVVGCLGDWRSAAAVLSERASLSWLPSPARPHSIADVDWWAGEGRILNCIDASYGAKWGSNQWYARGHVIVDRTGRARRATVLEVERCFGFPDGYTAIPEAAERHRYKALGNSWAVPCARWIGERIEQVEAAAGQVPSAASRGEAAPSGDAASTQQERPLKRSDYDKGCGIAPDGAYICNCGSCE